MNLILSLLRLSLTNPTDAGRVLVGLRLTPARPLAPLLLLSLLRCS